LGDALNKQDVIGRKIVKVYQSRHVNPNTGRLVYHVESIVFDNGAVLVFGVIEGDGEYYIDSTVHKSNVKQL
jgi:hypothetical protein